LPKDHQEKGQTIAEKETPVNSRVGSLAAVVVAVAVGALVTLAGSQGGYEVSGLAVFAWGAIVAYGLNWIAYVPSAVLRTEKFFDLMGSVTYLSVTVVALVLVGRYDTRSVLLAAMVAIWAARLGSFLLRRVMAAGSDSRFDSIKTDPLRLLSTWTLQGLWVLLTIAAALGAITAPVDPGLDWLVWAGLAVWTAGFAIEVTADLQKSAFKADPDNDGRFIDVGLWSWSRHPNYFGEIVLWVGVAMASVGALSGWRYATLVSPVFVFVLLRFVSGVPMLERSAEKRWGDDPAYRAHRDSTPLLLLRPPG
jgi:steroid 5-alpha reductase family enzyme